jgi:hypothetical protein
MGVLLLRYGCESDCADGCHGVVFLPVWRYDYEVGGTQYDVGNRVNVGPRPSPKRPVRTIIILHAKNICATYLIF